MTERKRAGSRTAILAGLAASFVTMAFSANATAAAFDNVVVFGDSLSDMGNVFIATKGAEPAAPYYAGRFSNGPVWIENVAAAYGIKLKPSLHGGSDHAYGGAETIAAVVTAQGTIPSLATQAKDYLKAAGGKADANALYTIWGGSNDLLNTAENDPLSLPTLPERFTKATVGILTLLHAAGAESFIIPDVPDVGLTPAGRATGSTIAKLLSDEAVAMNAALDVALLAKAAEGYHIYRLQDYSMQAQLTAAASLGLAGGVKGAPDYFNLTNVKTACLAGKTLCATPYQHFYWDSLHPTEPVHAMLAVGALTILPQ